MLEAPFESGIRSQLGTTAANMVRSLDIFCNYQKIAAVECSCFIIHGLADKVVPPSNGQALFSMLRRPHPPMWLEGVGHNDIPLHKVFPKVKEYLEQLSKEQQIRYGPLPDRSCSDLHAGEAEGTKDREILASMESSLL